MRKIIFILCLTSAKVFAWGPTGHRVVGVVAERFMNPKAHLNVHRILNGQSLSRVSTWSDEIKSDPTNYSHTFNWHYTDWKEGDHQHDETNSSGKLLTAISEQIEILKDPNAGQDKKAFALKFIVHLVGDLHQPLHIGNGLDQGGNKCKVYFHKKETNLHALWDEGLIEFTKLSYTELASFIAQGRTKEEVQSWKNGTLLDWALESKNIRASIYPEDIKPLQTPVSLKQYCRGDIEVSSEDMPKLGYEYSFQFVPVVEKRLFQAGLRLAQILNQTLN